MVKINKYSKLYLDKTIRENICTVKQYYYKTRSVSKAIANNNNNTVNTVNTVTTNPNVLKIHRYIPNIETSICNVRKTINIKNLRIKIPINTKKIYNNILK
jgi:hypothetical protein